MKVRAIKRGFFGGIYRVPNVKPHCEFDCPSDQVSSIWMREVQEGDKPIEKPEGYVPLEIPSLINKPIKKIKKK
jgi:hypothetical protein